MKTALPNLGGADRRVIGGMTLSLVLGLATIAARAQAPCSYEVTVLPNYDCGIWTTPISPRGVNNLGHMVGNGGCFTYEAVLWTGGNLIGLPRPAWSSGAQANALNDADDVVGYVYDENNLDRPRACMWTHDGEFVDLGLLPSANRSYALAINSNRQIVGYSFNDITEIPYSAFLWQDGVMNALALPMGPNSVAYDINNNSQITGWMGDSADISAHAYVWDDGDVIDLGVIPGGFNAQGRAIDESGTVVAGAGRIPEYYPKVKVPYIHALVWQDGEMQDIGTLPGFIESIALGTNGIVTVGYCYAPDLGSKPFIFQDGQMLELESLISPELSLGDPWSISAVGHIATTAFGGSVGAATVVLTPSDFAPSDVDQNCTIDVDDLLLVIHQWGTPGSLADINQDGTVNVLDLAILIQDWSGFSGKKGASQ